METEQTTTPVITNLSGFKLCMPSDRANTILKGLAELSVTCFDNSVKAGFWKNDRNFAEATITAITELCNAIEDSYKGNEPSKKIPDFTLVEENFADAIIRIMDISSGKRFNIASAVIAKLCYNAQQLEENKESVT